jgi:beta-galactosidase/beta-glucuronidase
MKIEPECFYYDCDRLGMVVFQDFVNNSDYSFFRDTALPTIGVKRINDKHLRRTEKAKNVFREHSEATVEHLYNHPSICLWTVFNEGWGQFDADRMFALAKEWDSSRFIDATSGWFWQNDNDFLSLHVYFKKVKMPKKSTRPIYLSEFGGYCYAVKDHLFDEEKSYGYKNFKSLEEFKNAFIGLYRNEIIPAVEKGLCASIYTQVSDVEEEINGIMTYDRKVTKLSPEDTLPIARELKIK